MRKVQIYVENQLIDLFNDEEISVKSQSKDINDISKTFADYSQSFSIPGSKVNNAIFGYYYNNDLGTLNANTRLDCRIEIDLIPFRSGKLQLEGAIVKNNQVSSYKVGFFGEVTSLKDSIGEAKLKDLDYSSIAQAHTGAIVQASITTNTPLDVRYPLISSERIWGYNVGGVGINFPAQNIVWDELFPAVTDTALFDIIQTQYGITFEGDFLTDSRFTSSYLYWKNRETTDFTLQAVPLTFNAGATSCNVDIPNAVGVDVVNFEHVDLNLITTPAGWANWTFTNPTPKHQVEVTITPGSAVTYYLDTYRNGILWSTNSSSVTATFITAITNNAVGLDDVYTFELRSTGALTFDVDIDYTFTASYVDTLNVDQVHTITCSYSTIGLSVVTLLDFNFTAPDMKVIDYLTGTFKQFNLTCYPTATSTYHLEPLDSWYANGDEINITPFVITDEINVDRSKMYNEISFTYQKSNSFMNEAFLGFNNRAYGDLRNIFPNNDGGKYEVSLPFENILFNNFDNINGNLQVAYCLTNPPDYKPYVPKPIKLYLQDEKTVQFYFNDGTSSNNLLTYMPFGQDVVYDTENYSMNFGSEISSLLLDSVNNSLYQTYYQTPLTNIFNPKTRIITVKAILPVTTLTQLSLDDKIIVRDKAYRINDMTVNLTTGLAKFMLISDWSPESTVDGYLLQETGDYILQETGFKIKL